MKYNFRVEPISKLQAIQMVQKYHYSNTLPKINKVFLGFYLDEELKGVMTLGYGVRPMHTIKKLFPSLDTKDYLEIGRMCMTEDMPRNSESQMISACCKWLEHNLKDVKVLFTWADGMLGKVGYVYQASSFIYMGYSMTDIYLKDGMKIHPRQTNHLYGGRPTEEQLKAEHIEHYKGKQFKYVKFLCGNKEKKALLRECLVPTDMPYPKEADLEWKIKNLATGEWQTASIPNYITDIKIEQLLPTDQISLF